MKQMIAVAAGGAVGALLRYLVSSWVYSRIGSEFPYGTLTVNVIGSFFIGILTVLLLERLSLDPIWRSILIIGMLGAFTTFSTFSLETLNLMEAGESGKAILNIVLSVVMCLFSVWIGIIAGRTL